MDQFTLFFTTKIGPPNLPEPHRTGLISVLDQNVAQFPSLRETLISNYGTDNPSALYDSNFGDFLKLAVPKALISRALYKDWLLDPELSYRGFVFDRTPLNIPTYTMAHYVLHFKRCHPSVTSQINPQAIPAEIRSAYGESVHKIFTTPFEDVDELKTQIESQLKASLAKLGVPMETL